MKTPKFIVLVTASLALALPVSGQVHGELIGGAAITNAPPVAPALAAPAKQNAPSPAPASATDGMFVGFDRLSGYPLRLDDDLESNTNRPGWADEQVNAKIPADIRALDKHVVSVEGYMVPMQFEKAKVTEFMLMRDPMGCCFSTMPEIHQFIKVVAKSPGVSASYDTVRVRGILHVGAQREAGVLSSIYRMEAEEPGK